LLHHHTDAAADSKDAKENKEAKEAPKDKAKKKKVGADHTYSAGRSSLVMSFKMAVGASAVPRQSMSRGWTSTSLLQVCSIP